MTHAHFYHLPADIVARCFLCSREFRSLRAYNAHRDMGKPESARVCMPQDTPKAPINL
jgi:hypothetical protein